MVKAPPSMKGSSLVVIRSYCRFPPVESHLERCRRPEPLYYYDVGSASCRPFHRGYCSRSRNRFVSEEACMKECIVRSEDILTTGTAGVTDTSLDTSDTVTH